MVRSVALVCALFFASPATAEWRHELSGVTLPDAIGDMRKGQERTVAEDGSDTFVQYGTDAEPVTLFVYRSSYPNPALWFDRTLVAMNGNVGQPVEPMVARRAFTLGAAGAVNGLRAEFAVMGKESRSTAVAMAQHGEWRIKARVTSREPDLAGVARRMDALLAAIAFARPAGNAPYPLQAPEPCSGKATYKGRPAASRKRRWRPQWPRWRRTAKRMVVRPE